MNRTPQAEAKNVAEHALAALCTASPQERRAALYLVLAAIPTGKVITYGELATLAGLGRAARWVGRTLSQLPPDTRLPWHRVLGANGRLSLPAGSAGGAEQRARLRAEGITLHNDRVDLRRHGWHPQDDVHGPA